MPEPSQDERDRLKLDLVAFIKEIRAKSDEQAEVASYLRIAMEDIAAEDFDRLVFIFRKA